MKVALLRDIQEIYAPFNSTVLALSGGPDSVLLFFLLLEYQKIRPEFTFHTFYLSHNMPGNKDFSTQSQQFVIDICKQYNVILHHREIDIQAIYQHQSDSLENIGRTYRYQYLKEIIEQEHIDTISTGHHQDDLVETILMRLFQGVSPSSFMAIKPYSYGIIRPLLNISKKDILNILHQHNYPYLLDPSNQDYKYKRNKIRLELIPILSEIFPHFQDKLIQFAHLLEEQNSTLQQQLPVWNYKEQEASIDLSILENLNPYLLREAIKQTIKSLDERHYLTYQSLIFVEQYIVNHKQIYTEHKILYSKQSIKIIRTKTQLICTKVRP